MYKRGNKLPVRRNYCLGGNKNMERGVGTRGEDVLTRPGGLVGEQAERQEGVVFKNTGGGVYKT